MSCIDDWNSVIMQFYQDPKDYLGPNMGIPVVPEIDGSG